MFLEIKDLKKYYTDKDELIRNLNFSVEKGDIVSFIGESGSGKTTFLKCLAGLEKINAGIIELNGVVLNDKDTFIAPNKRKIGFVFQDYPLFPHLNILENILINFQVNKKDIQIIKDAISRKRHLIVLVEKMSDKKTKKIDKEMEDYLNKKLVI